MSFSVFFLIFPRKLKLMKRCGFNKTNADFLAMAKGGDIEAKELVRDSKIVMCFAIAGTIVLTVMNILE